MNTQSEREGEHPAPTENGRQLKLVFEPPQEQDYCRSVVAIHGLETNDRTWIYKKDNHTNNWLKNENMLPAAVPGARVYTYDWSGNIFKGSTQEVLDGHAEKFLLHLKIELGSEPKPIIFIASCFGGLLLAAALTWANRPTSGYRGILLSTIGIVFLATPFRGSSAFKFARLPALVGRFLGERPSRKLTKRLDADDDLLQNLRDGFAGDMRHITISMPIVCFYELVETELLRRVLPGRLATIVSFVFLQKTRRMIVKRDSASLDIAEKFSLDTTHSMMNKFEDQKCWKYQIVHMKLKDIVGKETETLYNRKDCAKKAFDHLPNKEVPKFCGREDELKRVLRFMDPDSAECRRLIVITGLDGMGKTQFTFEVASHLKNKYPDWSIFWVSGKSYEKFKRGYLRIAADLELGSQSKGRIELVNKKLSKRPGRWLLIVDDLDTQGWELKKNLPEGQCGFVVVTTNDRFAAQDLKAETVTLEPLKEEEAIELMKTPLRSAQSHPFDDHNSVTDLPPLFDDHNSVTDLASSLKLFPLAIKLASNYMAETGTTAAQYLDIWNKGDEDLIDTLCRRPNNLGGGHDGAASCQRAVASTWLLSFDRILKEYPNSKNCLTDMAWYAQDRIPVSWFISSTDATEKEVRELIDALTAYSFVTKTPDRNFIDIHRPVQLAMRKLLPQREAVMSAIERLVHYLPFPTSHNDDKWEIGLSHAEEVLDGDEESSFDMSKWYLLYMTGHACFLSGEIEKARKLHRRAFHMESIKIAEDQGTSKGPQDGAEYEQDEDEHRDKAGPVATAMLPNGDQHGEQSDGVKESHPALKCWRKFSSIADRKSGACTLLLQGEYTEARDEYQAVFDIEKELLSEKHPSTISTLNSLAFAHKCCKDTAKAIESYRQVLELRKETLGQEDPSTIDSMDTLAIVYQNAGNYEEAERLHEDARDIKESFFGKEHASTARSRENFDILKKRRERATVAGDSAAVSDRAN